jgi:L-threonylcarbamoyladenylate synthase
MQAAKPSRLIPADAQGISRASAILRRGGLVAFPTETVYGLGADATNDRAVAAIFAAKQRPRFNPLIVHVADIEHAHRLVEFHAGAAALAERFWPGPLTLVLPRRANQHVSLLASAGLETIAIRVPSHAVAQALLKDCNLPIVAPSANPSGQVSPTTAIHVASDLADKVELILNGGPVTIGIESTVVGFEKGSPVLLRAGALSRARIESVVGPLSAPIAPSITAPGQLKQHYAPKTALRLEAREVAPDEALLAFGPQPLAGAQIMRNLSVQGNLEEAAANLFAMLRELDASEATAIAIMAIPGDGLGEAINDRLQRAAASDE